MSFSYISTDKHGIKSVNTVIPDHAINKATRHNTYSAMPHLIPELSNLHTLICATINLTLCRIKKNFNYTNHYVTTFSISPIMSLGGKGNRHRVRRRHHLPRMHTHPSV